MPARTGTRKTAAPAPAAAPGAGAVDVAHEILNNCVAGRVRQISRVVTARYDDELRPFGITANQVTVLSVVAALEQSTPTEMQPYLMMDASTISRNVQRMIANRWLALIPSDDRRSHYLVVAPAGAELLRAIRPAWQRAQAWAAETFDASGIASVRRIATLANPRIPR